MAEVLTRPAEPSVSLARRPFTVDEYDRMAELGILTQADNVELLDGEIVYMSPIGEDHADSVDEFNDLFAAGVRGRARVRIQNPIRVRPRSEPQPDIVIARLGKGHPGPEEIYLVIEVGDSTVDRDRYVKLPIYAKAGIAEYWLADLPGRCLEIYRDAHPDGYYLSMTRHVAGETVSPLAFPDVRIPVAQVLGGAPTGLNP